MNFKCWPDAYYYDFQSIFVITFILHCIITFACGLFLLTLFAFWQVCDWLYPLMVNSPVLLCNTGVFMFPDMMAPAPGYYVGVVLSSDLPAADRGLFQELLSHMTDLRVQVSLICIG